MDTILLISTATGTSETVKAENENFECKDGASMSLQLFENKPFYPLLVMKKFLSTLIASIACLTALHAQETKEYTFELSFDAKYVELYPMLSIGESYPYKSAYFIRLDKRENLFSDDQEYIGFYHLKNGWNEQLMPYIPSNSYLVPVPEGYELSATPDDIFDERYKNQITPKQVESDEILLAEDIHLAPNVDAVIGPSAHLWHYERCMKLYESYGTKKFIEFPYKEYDGGVTYLTYTKYDRYGTVRVHVCPFRYDAENNKLYLKHKMRVTARLKKRTDMPEPGQLDTEKDAYFRSYTKSICKQYGEAIDSLYRSTEDYVTGIALPETSRPQLSVTPDGNHATVRFAFQEATGGMLVVTRSDGSEVARRTLKQGESTIRIPVPRQNVLIFTLYNGKKAVVSNKFIIP